LIPAISALASSEQSYIPVAGAANNVDGVNCVSPGATKFFADTAWYPIGFD
jgi:hypothetical protein